jgi:hypothetical protein
MRVSRLAICPRQSICLMQLGGKNAKKQRFGSGILGAACFANRLHPLYSERRFDRPEVLRPSRRDPRLSTNRSEVNVTIDCAQ